ncbi:hypothetical protein GCM10027037_33190 [Mucilaginibacter koreensis]
MATSKLTLSVDADIIAKAKRYASAHQVSISKLFSDFIKSTATQETVENNDFLEKIKSVNTSAELKKLRGILKSKVSDDVNIWDAKYEYLKEKHGL